MRNIPASPLVPLNEEDAVASGGVFQQYLVVVISDAIESEISAAAKAAQLLYRWVKTEILLALEFAVVIGYQRKYPDLLRLDAVEIAQLPGHPHGVRRIQGVGVDKRGTRFHALSIRRPSSR